MFKMINMLIAFLMLNALWAIQGEPSVPQGFGRFGRYHDDGLLTLNVNAYQCESPFPMTKWTIRFADASVAASVASINQTEKVLNLSDGGTGSPTSLRLSLLFPGFAASFGNQAILHISGVAMKAELSEQSPDRSFHYILLTASQGKCMPVILAFRQGLRPDSWKQVNETGGSRLEINSANGIGEIRFITPQGMKEFSSAASVFEKNALRAMSDAWAARSLPILDKRTYQYNRQKNAVIIEEEFKAEQGNPISPIPPVLALALEKGYPASVDGTLETPGCITKYGPYAFVSGNKLKYTLPVPPLEERGYIRRTGDQDRADYLNTLVGHLGGSWATNAVDLGYAGMSNAHMAWAYLTSAKRTQVSNAWKTYLPLAFKMPPYSPTDKVTWKEDTEPFSNLSYVWTYKIDGPPPDYHRLDVDWGNALPLYGLYKYAQYTGDWEMARKNWAQVLRIFKYFDYGDDWAWMTVVNGDMGWSTGTGDPLCATYAGHVAALKMARVLKFENDEAHFAYKTARVCVPTLARFWLTDWARQQRFIGSRDIVQGFWEKETFTATTMNENTTDPWGPTNVLSGDGILPELFNAYITYAAPALAAYEQEYAQYYPDWANGNHIYSFETTYKGNSVYVTFPHIYMRALLGEPTADLWKYVDLAKINPATAYWVGPNVIAEILARGTPLILTEWQPAAFTDGVMSADGLTATLDFNLKSAIDWTLTGRVQGTLKPVRVTINSVEKPFVFENGILSVKTNISGFVKVIINWSQ